MDESISTLIDQAKQGSEQALAELFSRYRERLRAMISFRMDRNLRGRVDESDVLQETYLDLAKKLPSFEQKNISFLVWLRMVAKEALVNIHREHLGTQMRDPRREVRGAQKPNFDATSVLLAENLMGKYTSICGKAIWEEQRSKLNDILESMDETDREVIALRIFEELTNGETAEILGLTRQTTSKRFYRAIDRLKNIMAGVPGFD